MKLNTMKASKIIPIGHIMIRVEAEDYDAWLKTHYDHVEDRHSYGMTDGPVYRDIDNPNAALFHIHVENLDRAMQWFRTDTFKEATKRATVVGRDFYLAEKQQPRPQSPSGVVRAIHDSCNPRLADDPNTRVGGWTELATAPRTSSDLRPDGRSSSPAASRFAGVAIRG
jgi:hypothetical protein